MDRELNSIPYHRNEKEWIANNPNQPSNQATYQPTIIINRLLIIMTITIVVITTAAATADDVRCCSMLSLQ